MPCEYFRVEVIAFYWKLKYSRNLIRSNNRSPHHRAFPSNPGFLPRRGFLCREGQKIDVRASVRASVHFVSRSICQKSANLWQSIIGRILDSNLIYNVKIRHPSTCDDLVLRTQKVALGPPLPCGCNLVIRRMVLVDKYCYCNT